MRVVPVAGSVGEAADCAVAPEEGLPAPAEAVEESAGGALRPALATDVVPGE